MRLTFSDISLTDVIKRFALIYCILAAALTGLIIYNARLEQKKKIDDAVRQEQYQLNTTKSAIKIDLSGIKTDIRLIGKLPILQQYLNTDKPTLAKKLAQYFVLFSRETRHYDQIRYINKNGQELIRVNYNHGKPVIVQANNLQDKSTRYYIKDTLKETGNHIYVSPLDLNTEHGKLEKPFKPMIRLGMPVYDKAGHKKGAIVLNYYAKIILADFRYEMRSEIPHTNSLLNQNGFWLSSNNPSDEWGFMLGKKKMNFENRHPKAWSIISSSKQGTITSTNGIYVFTTLYPLKHPNSVATPKHTASTSTSETEAQNTFWKIVAYVPSSKLLENTFYNSESSKVLFILIYIALAVMAYIVAGLTLSRKRAKQKIIYLNRELDARLKESESITENLNVTLRSIGDGVITTDTDAKITRMNSVAEKLTGWAEHEAIGKQVNEVFTIINQKTRTSLTLPIQETLTLGVPQSLSIDTALLSRTENEYPISDSCAPIRDSRGIILGIVLVFKDISDEYAMQNAIREGAARVETILDSIAEGIHGIDLQGKIIFENPAAIRMLGWEKHEMIGQAAHELIHHTKVDGSHYAVQDCSIYATFHDGITRHVEDEVFWRKDGTNFPVAYTSTAMYNAQGQIIGAIASFQDITERKIIEQQLLNAKAQAEQANHAKDTFLATMSHEIRTPLTGILGMLEVLSLSDLNNEQSETLQAAWDSSKNLLRIVNDILDWSKIEEGKLELAPHPASLSALLNDVYSTYSSVASVKGLILKLYLDPALGQTHIVDALRLSQVLNNFVSNAIKFTEHGSIEIRGELLERTGNDEHIRLSVQDTGIGIPDEIQKQLFQRYRQGSVETTRMYGGTGLGLSICQRIVELMDGKIELSSKPGLGSIFSITLVSPVSSKPVVTLPTQYNSEKQGAVSPLFIENDNAPVVLAVDDHPINRKLLSNQIILLGLKVETASNGIEALSKWRTGKYSLVITDCHMPEMDGYTLAREIRRFEKTEKQTHKPIIAWTASALAEEVERCHNAGMDELLIKPANLSQLKKMLIRFIPGQNTETTLAPTQANTQSKSNGPIDHTLLAEIVPDQHEHLPVLKEFQTHIRDDFGKLQKILQQGNLSELEVTAHRMKGSCRMVGALHLAMTCESIEHSAHDGALPQANTLRDVLAEEIEKVDSYIYNLEKN